MDLETKVNREILRAAVARQIMCQVTGHVLNVRSAVLAEIKMPSENVINVVVTGRAWDDGARDRLTVGLPGATITVYDGRELYAKARR